MIVPLSRLTLAVAAVGLAGCTTDIPVISASIDRPIKAEDLAATCATPVTIAAGASYQELIRAFSDDRKNLVACEKCRQFLQNAIGECNDAIRKSNGKIDELNKKYAGKP